AMADRPHDTILKFAVHDGSNDRCCSKIPDHLSQLRVVKDRGAQPPQMGVREVARMSNTSLTGVKACVFDAYGTLFDFASAAKRCRDVLGDGIDKLTALWRGKQLQNTWLRALPGRHPGFLRGPPDALRFGPGT